jgi:hypothetical protein
MSICINNDLIWISIPRCASFSIETALVENTQLNITSHLRYTEKYRVPNTHWHVPKNDLYQKFGKLETICIKRNYFDRWLSALGHLWKMMEWYKYEPIVKFEDIDNEFIYNFFTIDICNNLMLDNADKTDYFLSKLATTESIVVERPYMNFEPFSILQSQNKWKTNGCTYEFDFDKLGEFEKFIEDRYNITFKLPHLNTISKKKSKIIVNDELKSFVWEMFETPYATPNKRIHLI